MRLIPTFILFFILLNNFSGLVAQKKELFPLDSLPTFGLKKIEIDDYRYHSSLRIKKYDPRKIREERRRKIKDELNTLVSTDSLDANFYKIISFERDTTIVDTTLTIDKEYKYNFLRRDRFGYIPFANTANPHNSLTLNDKIQGTTRDPGFTAKNFGYVNKEDVNYYKVATPFSELLYRTVFEQGQQASALISLNMAPQINLTLSYQGLLSLGKYRNVNSNHGRFISSFNYSDLSDKYNFRLHFASHNLENNENGGITEESIFNFESADEEFKKRSKLEVNYTDAINNLIGERFYFDQYFKFKLSRNDASHYVKIHNDFVSEKKQYLYDQSAAYAPYGDSFNQSINDEVNYEERSVGVGVEYHTKYSGGLKLSVKSNKYNYFYQRILYRENDTINSLNSNETKIAGIKWKNEIGKLKLGFEASKNLNDDYPGSHIEGNLSYKIPKLDGSIKLNAVLNSRLPNINFDLYQSNYERFNWKNDFAPIKTIKGLVSINHKYLGEVSMDYFSIENYTYFDNEIKPKQSDNKVDITRVTASNNLDYWKLGLSYKVLYQSVGSGLDNINLPKYVTRVSLYFKDDVFEKDPLFLMAGVTFKRFSPFYIDNYSPVLSEFFFQREESIGGFPLFDLFVNGKVRNTRIYFRFEHINTLFSKKRNYYSTIAQPYRDFNIRFGFIWNFFN